ncbi:nanos homolog 3 [Thalassophryne amazonica]|uniref:nanos homolog 3 n=1 Tax=Thalassophryne amazonica TaxID=390379 RepID=UPI0014711221|nr:nanos homolog 3 [Thalassophryne amazonica]
METQVRVQSSLLPDRNCFDMWRDYMNLCRLLEKLCGMSEVEPRGGEQPTSRRIQRDVRAKSNRVASSSSDYCRFCKRNGETAQVYESHRLKSYDGKTICPILYNYTCPLCGGTGEKAHTRRYCPQTKSHR